MAVYKKDGTQVTETSIEDVLEEVPNDDPLVTVTEPLYQGKVPDGTTFPETQHMLLFHAGQQVRRSVITKLFPNATIESVTPTGGPAAGGTKVTVRGTGFTPGATVKFDTTAATQVDVDNDRSLTCVAPAHAAGAVDVTVTTDSGAVTLTGGFTYA